MADEAYKEFKEEQKAGTVLPITGRIVFQSRRRRREMGDYSRFKATVETAMESAVEELKQEINAQHERTREAVQTSKRDLLSAIKASPVESIKLMSEFGSLFLLFALAIRFTLGIELVNTGFSLFMLVAFAVYWLMARLKEWTRRRRDEDTQT
jgi:hypothetical protein